MNVAAESIVTIYGDIMAFLLLLGLLVMASGFRGKKDLKSQGLFTILCVLTMVNCLSNGVSYALHHQSLAMPRMLRMIMPTIAEFSTLAVVFIWLVYVDYKLYESWDRTKMIEKIFRVPVIVILVLFIINIPTGIMFDVAPDFVFEGKPLFYVVTAFQFLYGLLPVAAYIRYVYNHGYKHFFHISPVVLSTLVSAIFTLVTRYSARSYGFAIAIVFLYFSYINRWRFDDDETGFYNINYIDHLTDLARSGKIDYHSAIYFDIDNFVPEVRDIFKAEVPKDGEIIRVSDKRFLLLSESGSASMITALSGMIQEDADEYDEKHPDATISLSSSGVIRKKNESALDFMARVRS